MCGFAGFINGVCNHSRTEAFNCAVKMNAQLYHRGPDSNGIYVEPSGLLALAHSRLSVVDLSENGAQPMYSDNNRYVLVFNGEIYNHREIRRNLEQSFADLNWKGNSDTETLLKSIQNRGIKATLQNCEGMFAFALYDMVKRKLYLARDRLGEKPLYYGWQGLGGNRTFLFGSELKALKQHFAFEGRINHEALNLLLRHNYIPAPHSIYEGIYKLAPASLLEVDILNKTTTKKQYWDLSIKTNSYSAMETKLDSNQVVNVTETLLTKAIRKQLLADVPIGAFLSGGIDSTLVTTIMQKQSSRPIDTFTIGFDDVLYNEAASARAIAKYLGTNHTEFVVTPRDAINIIPHLPEIFCEPFADASQIPTVLLCQMAKSKVTVALSGDGGDELFSGYSRYGIANNVRKKLRITPKIIKKLIISFLKEGEKRNINFLSDKYINKADKIVSLLEANSAQEVYNIIVSGNIGSHLWMQKDLTDPKTPASLASSIFNERDFIYQMSAIDLLTYLPDDILTKVDRAAMSVSLETRLPLLDNEIVEFAMNIPSKVKRQFGKSKWPLRQVLKRHVPEGYYERPKKGFSVPIAAWLRSPLRDWADDLLSEETIARQGFFSADKVSRAWEIHRSSDMDVSAKLWPILMFQDWLDKNA